MVASSRIALILFVNAMLVSGTHGKEGIEPQVFRRGGELSDTVKRAQRAHKKILMEYCMKTGMANVDATEGLIGLPPKHTHKALVRYKRLCE